MVFFLRDFTYCLGEQTGCGNEEELYFMILTYCNLIKKTMSQKTEAIAYGFESVR